MTYLKRDPKSGTYYFRRGVPAAIRGVIGKREWKESLGTKDVATAKRLAHEVGLKVEAEFARAAQAETVVAPVAELTEPEIFEVARSWYQDAVQESDVANVEGGKYTDEAYREEVVGMEELAGVLKRALGMNDSSPAKPIVDRMLADRRASIAEDSASYKKLCHTMLRAMLEALQQAQAKLDGNFAYKPSDPLLAEILAAQPPSRSDHPRGNGDAYEETLSQILEGWLRERKPPVKTEHEWRRAVRRWEELHGKRPVSGFSVADVSAFKDCLLRCPARPPNAIRVLPLPKLAEAGDTHPELPKTTAGAVNKTVGAIRSLLSHAVKNGKAERNVALGVSAYDPPKMEDEERRPFTTSELQQICEAAWRESRESDRWLPLMGAFMGARQSEMGEAKAAHVVTEEEITYLRITEVRGERRIKNISSRRKVPLHPELVRLGFLEYVGKQPAGGMLFPQFNPAAYSKRFGELCAKLGLDDPYLTFHSLRHGYKDACRLAGILEEVHDSLTGHAFGGRGGRRYGKGVPLTVLGGAVEKIVYPDLDLTGLSRRT